LFVSRPPFGGEIDIRRLPLTLFIAAALYRSGEPIVWATAKVIVPPDPHES